jgi:hypothetical protein
VFAFYQPAAPPVFFNPRRSSRCASPAGAEFAALAEQLRRRGGGARRVPASWRAGGGDEGAAAAAQERYRRAPRAETAWHDAIATIRSADAPTSDTNYVFLSFVLAHLPAGLVGLVFAAIFAASMNSTAAELNALTSTTVIDVIGRLIRPDASERHYPGDRAATVGWGLFAIAFAEHAGASAR